MHECDKVSGVQKNKKIKNKKSPFTSSQRCLHIEMRMDYFARCALERSYTGLEAIYLISKIISTDSCFQMMFF